MVFVIDGADPRRFTDDVLRKRGVVPEEFDLHGSTVTPARTLHTYEGGFSIIIEPTRCKLEKAAEERAFSPDVRQVALAFGELDDLVFRAVGTNFKVGVSELDGSPRNLLLAMMSEQIAEKAVSSTPKFSLPAAHEGTLNLALFEAEVTTPDEAEPIPAILVEANFHRDVREPASALAAYETDEQQLIDELKWLFPNDDNHL